ncbi:MAG: phosphoribosylformylglycinamidine synthase subunit PurQ [Planctomycetota bacterium]|jgi:phosphoribosylformylglycinamidine synthase
MPTALILTAAGINCDRELSQAFELAGASAEPVHLNRLLREPSLIDRYDLIGLPGGFSYGDAVGAGRIVAALMRQHLYRAFVSAIERGVPIIAPCNGFQIAVQVGLLPGPAAGEPWPPAPPQPAVALAPNESARFIDRWCGIEIPPRTRCIWTQGIEVDGERAVLPVAHGEGRFLAGAGDGPDRLAGAGMVAVRYRAGDNPNGSVEDIAGICDASGLVLGLMPHPERFTRWTQHPRWTRLEASRLTGDPLGLAMFRNAVAHVG